MATENFGRGVYRRGVLLEGSTEGILEQQIRFPGFDNADITRAKEQKPPELTMKYALFDLLRPRSVSPRDFKKD